MIVLKSLLNLGVSLGIALTATIALLIVLSCIVDLFRLNYKGNTYWVLNVCVIGFWISWILSFGYLMSRDYSDAPKPAKLSKPYREPLQYVSSNVNGNVESIHIWGRTEVVPVTQVKLTVYFSEEDPVWELSGSGENNGIIQPEGRKDYFIPVMTGPLNIQFGSAQLIETSNVGYGDKEGEYWNEFRVANLIFKDDKPVSLLYKHYNYQDGIWKEIAGYEAVFKETKNEKEEN